MCVVLCPGNINNINQKCCYRNISHQLNQIKKLLWNMHGLKNKKDNVAYLPQVGQNVRSYTLENDKCISQCGVNTAYTGNPDSPYKVASTQDVGIEIDCKLDILQGRLEGTGGLTGEEQSLKDKLVVKYFETEPLSVNENLKQKRKLERGEKLKQIQGMALFQGDVYDVTRDENRTLISLLYPKDLDKEDLEVGELLTKTAFNDNPNKRKRIEQLKLPIPWNF